MTLRQNSSLRRESDKVYLGGESLEIFVFCGKASLPSITYETVSLPMPEGLYNSKGERLGEHNPLFGILTTLSTGFSKVEQVSSLRQQEIQEKMHELALEYSLSWVKKIPGVQRHYKKIVDCSGHPSAKASGLVEVVEGPVDLTF